MNNLKNTGIKNSTGIIIEGINRIIIFFISRLFLSSLKINIKKGIIIGA